MTSPDGQGEPGTIVVELAPGSVDALASRIAELLTTGQRPKRDLIDAAEVSRLWGVERSWVYEHADELGARRLGAGPRPRLRFDPDEIAERLQALGHRPTPQQPDRP